MDVWLDFGDHPAQSERRAGLTPNDIRRPKGALTMMADAPSSNGVCAVARNIVSVLGVLAVLVWFVLRLFKTVSVDGVNCGNDSTQVAVPSYELSACAVAIDSYHQALVFVLVAALVLFVIAYIIHWFTKRSAAG
ncbi:MAG: hypothetical protein M3O06_12065 [Pseudomonadota bacterium]|nr:hypothetical protein [Pseudomonadota bacterium]